MQYKVITSHPATTATECLVVVLAGAIDKDQVQAHPVLSRLDDLSVGALSLVLGNGDLQAKAGSVLLLPILPGIEAQRVLFVHAGLSTTPSIQDALKTMHALASALLKTRARSALCCWQDIVVAGRDLLWLVEQTVLAFEAASYRCTEFKHQDQEEEPAPSLQTVSFCVPKSDHATVLLALEKARGIGTGVGFARDLGNRPANLCTPSYLAGQAQDLAKNEGIKCQVLDERQIQALKMGSFLSVTAGATEPARLIVLEYHPVGGPAQAPVVLVGKGITFDSGGISIKPGQAMDEMKFDMCGGAAVLGVFRALIELRPKIHVVGIIAAAENMPDGGATRPGDIVTSMSGQTIEVLNTDAEGRLVLCDALTYAERYNPQCIIDIATLTGACVIALGAHASGLYANDDSLAEELLAAGNHIHDRAWHMPLWDDYQEQLHSNFADVANIGGRKAGSVTAACFLSRFARNQSWAHLDIAGTAWLSGKEKGATGRPVGLLMQFLLDRKP